MENNIFREIQEKRKNFEIYAQKALEYGWITQEEFDEFIHKIENDKLTIGVIGQMKCGKSTFLNALIFEDEVLPAATTPMTASLSVITYGEEKQLEAEFYNREEWAELQMTAGRDLAEVVGNSQEESKIKAAKELLAKSVKISGEIDSLLGTTRKDKFENLIEYVGAEGKYISITKSVTLEYPLDYLKGVEIVDTPGFNDPIVSREERTKEFLKKADVVVMLLYAGRAFDATDKDIIFNLVRNVGIGKILIGVNKYDLCYEQGETETEIIAAVREQLVKASRDYGQNNSIGELVRNTEPVLLSANMALMSKMPLSKIQSDSNWQFYYKKALDIFEISNQQQMFQKSLMRNFENAVKEQVIRSKNEILLAKPKNRILQIGENKSSELNIEMAKLKEVIEISSMSKEKAEEILYNIEKAKKRAERKINDFQEHLSDRLLSIVSDIESEIKEIIKQAKRKTDKEIIDLPNTFIFNYKADKNHRKLNTFINYTIEDAEKEIRDILKKKEEELANEAKHISKEFIDSVENICEKYLGDFDTNSYIKKISKLTKMNLKSQEDTAANDTEAIDSSFSIGGILLEMAGAFFEGMAQPALKVFGAGNNIDKDIALANVREYFDSLLPQNVVGKFEESISEMSEKIRDVFVKEFLAPIEEQLSERMQETSVNNQKIQESQQKITEKLEKSKVLQNQISVIKELAKQI
ncbi:dynamin family protein [Capnocytophaga canimorsus]|uniref:dynamin family protein n=1 Tax=Capnocytophaga canimorsus TaxID=28188 RepID=UPI0037D707B6